MPEVSTETVGAARIVRFNNPPRGYLTAEGAGALRDALQEAGADEAVRTVILTGAGDVFIRHYDVSEIVRAAEAVKAGAIGPEAFEAGPFVELCGMAAALPKPVIAAINGTCMGGGFELALACDFRIAQAEVREIGLPETRIGIFPGGGGTQRLPRLIGEAAALAFILKGEVVSAGEALEIGLVNDIADDALACALDLADTLAARPAEGLAAAKRLVRSAADASLAEGLRAEQHAFHDVLKTDGATAGMARFLEGGEDITA